MQKKMLLLALMAGIALTTTGLSTTNAAAATKIPSKFRHSWYQPLKNTSNPSFIKLKATSIDAGSKTFHQKLSGKQLQVLKKKSGWYQIGAKGITNPTYKVTKLKVDGKKRTVLLKKYTTKSHYADVYVIGTKTKISLNAATLDLG